MPFVMKETQFVLDNAHSLFNHCHASTIVRVPNSERLLTAFSLVIKKVAVIPLSGWR